MGETALSMRPNWRRLALRLVLLGAAIVGVVTARSHRRQIGAIDHAAGSSSAAALEGPGRADSVRENALWAPPPTRLNRWLFLLIAVLALAGMGFLFTSTPKAAAGGWLSAFVFWSGIPIGSATALMIYTLTGGRWGARFAAVFMPSAAAIPLMAVLFVPVLAEPSWFYPWTSKTGGASAEVLQFYLNTSFFIARSVIAFCLWTFLGFTLPRLTGWPAVLVAAIGLAWHALIIGPIGTDWILSLEPVFISDSFGASLALTQLASAFAWAVVLSPGCNEDIGLADIGGLLLATLLGVTYMNFIAVLVIWYGDLPDRVFWFIHRDHWPWTAVGAAAFILGSVVPIFSLFLERVRSTRRGLRIMGVITLAGIAAYYAYLITPPFGALSIAAPLLANVAIGALLIAFIGTSFAQAGFYRWRSDPGNRTYRS